MNTTLNGQLKKLLLSIFVPMGILLAICIVMFIVCNLQYANASRNIARASEFSRDFRDDIDLKMYYFATDSEYATGIPYDEVETALILAKDLGGNTQNRESLKAINSVVSLCENLRGRMEQVRQAKSFDERNALLESNVNILTELIQNYMYTYLYYEAGELANLQKVMTWLLYIEIAFMFAMTAVTVALTVHRSIRISRGITQPIDGLYSRVRNIAEGDLQVREPVAAADMKVRALSIGFEEMVGRLNDQMELNRLEDEKIRHMELMLLQAQINPHFLYNTLDTIIWLIETGKNGQAIEMVTSLSNFFRTSLSKGRDVITLSEEALHVRSYLEIQQVRYRDILDYDIDIDSELGEVHVPKLTLQPIVENALYHGIKLKRGRGRISVSGHRLGDRVLLTVADTGIGMNAEQLEAVRNDLGSEHANGFGMSAVYKRLKLMFKEDCSFDIDSTEGEGTTVSVTFPVGGEWEKDDPAVSGE